MLRKMFLAASLVGITAVAGVGITFALFSDSKAADPAEFTAGNVSIYSYRDQGDTVYGPLFYIDGATDGESDLGEPGLYPTGLWAPGDEHRRVFMIGNDGSLDAKLVSIGAILQEGSVAFADQLQVTVRYQQDNGPIIAQGSLADFINNEQHLTGGPILLAVDDETNFRINVKLPIEAGNELQGETLKVTFYVNAEQAKNNP